MRMSRTLRLAVAALAALFGLLGAAGGVATAMPIAVPQPPLAGAPAVSPHAATDPPYDKVHAPWGPDVSGWQHPAGGRINWAAVRGAGASFAFVKASEGTGYTSPYYRSDTTSARAQGLYVGGYHFARPRLPISTAATEANYFANIIGNVRGRGWLPPVLDLEVTGGLSPANVTAWAHTFLQTLQARTGRVPILYSGGWFYRGYMFNPSGFGQYPLWDALYNKNISSPGTLFGDWTRTTFWQYTWQRSVPGIIGLVDASYFHGSRAQLAALANDAPVPAAPTIGVPTRRNASATVRWTAPTNTGSPITGYTVRVYTGTGTAVLKTVTALGGSTSLAVSGLTNGTGYTFTVAATNAVGAGALSARSNTVTPATVPAAPTIGVPTRGNASATVRWTAPTNTGGSPITGYTVRVYTGAGTTVLKTVTALGSATSLAVTGLTNGTGYTFTVAATNAVGAGALSARSAAVTPATVPTAPAIRTAIAGATGGAITATATWAAPTSTGGAPITGYRVTALRMSAAGAVLAQTTSAVQPATNRSLQMTVPTAGNYRFTVQATNAAGASPQSARSNLVAGR